MTNTFISKTILVGVLIAATLVAFPNSIFAQTSPVCYQGVLYNENGPAGVCPPGTPEVDTEPSYQFSRSGIFDCSSQAGAEAMSGVGTRTAIQALYVPVFDAAVTRNTGTLVYKECILDTLNARMRENAAFSHSKLGLTSFIEGRDGGPMFPVDYIADTLARSDEAFLHTLDSNQLSPLNDAFEGEVISAVAQNYRNQTRAANEALACPYEDIGAVLDGTTNDIWGGLRALMNPACNPIGAYNLARKYVQENIDLEVSEMNFRLTTGGGIYGVEEVDPETGRHLTRTPARIVGANVEQLITSGYRQLENADEIGQMVDALYSGLSAQVISDTRGLTGIVEQIAGQPSYLDQIASGLTKGLRDSAVNVAMRILLAAKQTELIYFNAMNAIAVSLMETMTDLREAEKACWALVVPKAQEYASSHSFQITVATTTDFSKAVIDAQIFSIATTTATNIGKSETALGLIDRLIAGITNTTSQDAQRVALQQLDSLVAQGALHGEYDAQQATKRKDEIKAAMKTLTEDTLVAWADSDDASIGWCNINNPSVIQRWAEEWRI